MGRNKLCTEQDFRKAHKKTESIEELAALLKIAVPTVYVYIRRYKVKPYPRPDKLDPMKVGAEYQFNVTIDDMARHHQVSRTTIYYCLRKLIFCPNQYTLTPRKKTHLPPPKKLSDIKIINLIRKHLKYIDCPWPMIELPGITEEMVDSYYRHAFGYALKRYEKGDD